MSLNLIKKYPTIGCCGLDCGLCPIFYIVGTSKCPGCCGPDFFNKHPACSYITCCVKKKKLEVCSQCEKFRCSKFKKWLKDGPEYDSFITYKKALPNLIYIKQNGLEIFIDQQSKRIKLLETMLNNYNDGRSKNFYCIATTLIPIIDLIDSLNRTKQKIKSEKIMNDKIKIKSKILKEFLSENAMRAGIKLKLRKKVKK